MKTCRIVRFALLLLAGTAAVAFPQGAFVIRTGPAFPAGDFAKDDPRDSHAGLAGTGAAAGAAYYRSLSGSALGWFASADVLVHPCSREARDAWQASNRNARITLPAALLLPVSGGLLYTLQEDKKGSLYIKAGFSAALAQYTRLEVKEEGYEKYSEEYDLAFSPGYLAGAGISGRRIILEADYIALGRPEISGTWNDGELSGNLPQTKKKVALFELTLGWKF